MSVCVLKMLRPSWGGGGVWLGGRRLVCVKTAPLVFHAWLALTPDSVTMPRRGTQAQSVGASHLV